MALTKLFSRQDRADPASRRRAELHYPGYGAPDYSSDALAVWGKDVSFIDEPRFAAAYRAGIESGHKITPTEDDPGYPELHIEWRVHMVCWAAWHARGLPGSFVECGVNTGIMSLAACHYVDFNSTGKDFFLFDTYEGIPEEQMAPGERADRLQENARYYEDCYDMALRNFASFPRAHLVRGRVPESLRSVEIDRVCYLALDMNIAEPEIAAIEHFWDRLVVGAPVLLDDYGWRHYSLQKAEMDRFAARKGVKIATLPTGQGLLMKR
jgi:O-methyltransferase